MSIISARNISYTYEADPPVHAIKNIDINIAAGEFVAIQGPSGSGKSTLLHVLGCMLKPKTGQLFVDDVDTGKLSKEQLAYLRNQKFGFIFQHPYLLPRANILENILLPTQYPYELASEKTANVKKAMAYAKKLELEHRLNHYPNKLSGGEQQRVVIARSLIRNAKIIFADEPTGNLDSRLSKQVLDYLITLKQEENLTVIMVTHDDKLAHKAEKILRIHDGVIQSVTKNTQVNYKQTAVQSPTKSAAIKKIFKLKQSIFAPFNIVYKLAPLAFKNILRSKIRSLLTMLGIVIGIAAIVATVTLGQFTKNKILKSYTALGANTLAISGYPNWQIRATDKISIMFDSFSMKHDIEPLTKIFPRIQMLSPVLFQWGIKLNYAGKNLTNNISMLGVGDNYTDIAERTVAFGSKFSLHDIKQAKPVCLIGQAIAKRLFRNSNPLEKVVRIDNDIHYAHCTITGVLDKRSSNNVDDFADQNSQILVPYTFFSKINHGRHGDKIYRFIARIKNAQDVQDVGFAVQKYFDNKYDTSAEFIIDPNILLLAQMRKFLSLFTMMLAAVSVIALVVGGIGITNMMLVNISEQFKEIGLRKALGATDHEIQIQFFIEAITLCCLAGITGLIFGFLVYEGFIYGAARIIRDVEFEWVFSLLAIGLAIVSMIVVGTLSGIYPAWKAKSLEIVAALRSE